MNKGCTYPIMNALARAATPKLCGNDNGGYLIVTLVPYLNQFGGMETQAQRLCTKHACEVASWKFVQELPKTPFTGEELEYLQSLGFELIDLVPEGALDADSPRSTKFKHTLDEAGITDGDDAEDIILDA